MYFELIIKRMSKQCVAHMCQQCLYLGAPIKSSKVVGPTACLNFVGIELHTIDGATFNDQYTCVRKQSCTGGLRFPVASDRLVMYRPTTQSPNL